MGPQDQRNPSEALTHARKAVELAPENHLYHNSLGVAPYRVGGPADAIPEFERSLRDLKDDSAAYDHFFLAMCQHRLGKVEQARDAFARGVGAMQRVKERTTGTWTTELAEIQAEAEFVLSERGEPAGARDETKTDVPPARRPR